MGRAGIFPSHIGFESAVGKDCSTLTRSLMAENSPYYEAGVKLSYTTADDRWFMSALILNGWQRIQRVDGNSLPAFGTQLTFRPGDAWTINSSTFVGADTPDAGRRMRYFHDLYAIFQPAGRVAVTVAFDIGGEEKSVDDSDLNSWWSAVAIVSVTAGEKWNVAARGEYYHDAHNVIIASPAAGFRTTGVSINADHQVTENVVWRTEVRGFFSPDPVFAEGTGFTDNNIFAGTSLALSF
ncbi:MAG: porin [Bacteroidia bacterium]|nr:porin [Bacteroidia bacterium]